MWLAISSAAAGPKDAPRGKRKPTKVVGQGKVPVYNSDKPVPSRGEIKSWNVMLKHEQGIFQAFTTFFEHAMCDWKSSIVPCKRQGHPEKGGIGFVNIMATEAELDTYINMHPTAIEFVELDLPISVPVGELDDSDASLLEEDSSSLTSRSSAFYTICYTGQGSIQGFGPVPRFNNAKSHYYSCIPDSTAAAITYAVGEFKLIKWSGPNAADKDLIVADMQAWWESAQDGPPLTSSGWPMGHWGLDRIDSRMGLDESYDSNGLDGSGVHVYVLDTGIRTTHAEFGGRAIPTLESLEDRFVVCDPGDVECANDSNGHGTHCAATVGGAMMGVAKNVTLHAVKVLNTVGTGAISSIISAIDWIMQNAIKPAVITMSLSNVGAIEAYETMIDRATAAGIVVVVAAGNEYDNACDYSPAYVPSAITVGATTIGDTKAGFSNWGSCIDVFAPGEDVLSAWGLTDNMYMAISGTSMACPHVAGAAALWLQNNTGATGMTPAVLKARMLGIATKDALTDLRSESPNLLLYVEPAPQVITTVITTTPSSAETTVEEQLLSSTSAEPTATLQPSPVTLLPETIQVTTATPTEGSTTSVPIVPPGLPPLVPIRRRRRRRRDDYIKPDINSTLAPDRRRRRRRRRYHVQLARRRRRRYK
jgi:subtilisin family serine protease